MKSLKSAKLMRPSYKSLLAIKKTYVVLVYANELLFKLLLGQRGNPKLLKHWQIKINRRKGTYSCRVDLVSPSSES